MFNPGQDIEIVIENVHDGRASLVEGVIAFRPNGKGRPETARYALVNGNRVAITPPKASTLAKGAYETRISQ